MSYQKYQTETLVLGTFVLGEADRTCTLYTEAFGLVRARAAGVRKEASKMRAAIQNGSHAYVALVRGKAGWRLAGATATGMHMKDPASIRAFARLSLLVERLVVHEERNEELFLMLVSAHEALRAAPERSPVIELLSVARALHLLGYLSPESLGTALFTHMLFDDVQLDEASSLGPALLDTVNHALSETQL